MAGLRSHGVTLPDDECLQVLQADITLNTAGIEHWLEEMARLYHRLRPALLTGDFARDLAQACDEQMARLHLPFDPVEAVHQLSDDLYHHEKYRFG